MSSPPTYSQTPMTISSLQHWILPMSVQTYYCTPHLKKPSRSHDHHPADAVSSLFFPLQELVYYTGLFPPPFLPLKSAFCSHYNSETTLVKVTPIYGPQCQSQWPYPMSRSRVVSHQASSVKCFRAILPVSEERNK